MKTVFITRELTDESPFYHLLRKKGWSVKGESFLEFSGIDFVVPPVTDWVFFYSKNGIKYFFEKIRPNSAVRYGVMSQPSAVFLKKYGIEADFIGTGEAKTTAAQFGELAAQKTVLFPCATFSKHAVSQLLGAKIKSINLAVYNNQKKTNIEAQNADVLVFTSPMNAVVYFEHFSVKNHQKIIAIGTTTAAELTKLGIEKYEIATMPSEVALAEAVLNLA